VERILGLFFVFAAMLVYIWRVRDAAPEAALLIALPIVHSFLADRIGLGELGLLPSSFRSGAFATFSLVLPFVALLFVVGAFVRPFGEDAFGRAVASFIVYLPWAFLQQVVLNGYFANHIHAAMGRRTLFTTLLSGILFGILHAPNPLMMLVTSTNSVVGVWLFLRYRNIYWLALAHALVGVTIREFLPFEWHHDLDIGPDFRR